MYEAMLDRKPAFQNGYALYDFGYIHAGLDDCWQNCDGRAGTDPWHDQNGNPIVNLRLFPNLTAMTTKAKNLGLYPGWYMNNCHCSSSCRSLACFHGDSHAVVEYGFTGVKIDGCSAEKNISLWAELLNATGQPVLIENCHNGPEPQKGDANYCPFHMFRTSSDNRPTFGTVLHNLQSILPFTNRTVYPAIGPGCWPYMDMLEVGVTTTQGPLPPLTFTQARSHFGAWCILSSPLILSFDLTDLKVREQMWPFITNYPVIETNQAWYGDIGHLVVQSTKRIVYHNVTWGNNDEFFPSWQVFAKAIDAHAVSIFILNSDSVPNDISFDWSIFPELAMCADGPNGCLVQSLWDNKRIGRVPKSYTAKNLASQDSQFLLVSVEC